MGREGFAANIAKLPVRLSAIGAIWESVHAKKDYTKLGQQWRSGQPQ
jgi:hypothetical protein